MSTPERGEVWIVYTGALAGRESAGTRPVLILSADWLNREPAIEKIVILPLTMTERPSVSHVPIRPPEGGVRESSFIMCELPTVLSRELLIKRWGTVTYETMRKTEESLSDVLDL